MPTHEGETVKADPAINPNSLLPAQRTYYRYPGSLTTSPCSETVEWLLLTTPIQVADADIAGFAKLYAMNAWRTAVPCYVRVDGCTKVRFGQTGVI